ncbi:MAG: hypothetical protein WAK48_32655, partial [Candidatus Acidiferrum sp.]
SVSCPFALRTAPPRMASSGEEGNGRDRFYGCARFFLLFLLYSRQRIPHKFSHVVLSVTKSRADSSYELLFRGSSFALTYSSPSGPIAVTCVTYSPDFAQWKWDVLPGRMTTAPGG